jgi:RNA polymerase-binding transcription factor DksA
MEDVAARHRSRLEADRETTVERLGALRRGFDVVVEATVDANSDDEHDPEGVTIAYERSQIGAFIDQAQAHLDDIEAALGRIADGTYGRCASCGRAIPEERLEARPTATLCVSCAAAGRGRAAG